MKHFILGLTLFHSLFAAAQAQWTVPELQRKFLVRGEMFELDPSGKRVLVKAQTWNIWKSLDKKGKIENQWSSTTEEYSMALKHNWQIQDDGTIKVRIEQYKTVKQKGEVVFEDLVKKEERVVENLDPITLVVYSNDKKRVVARFTPDFEAGDAAKDVSDIPLAGNDVMITDNSGYVWGTHITQSGKYSGFSTYKGTIFLSYYPFPGAKQLGVASGNEIEIQLDDKKTVTFTSKTSYVPDGMSAKVYGMYYPDRKSGKYPSVGVMDRQDEKEFVERIKTWPK